MRIRHRARFGGYTRRGGFQPLGDEIKSKIKIMPRVLPLALRVLILDDVCPSFPAMVLMLESLST